MPAKKGSTHTAKEKRQAKHIKEGYKKRGVSGEEAERRAWATVNDRRGRGKSKKSSKK